jgi:hypothetical protein
VVKRAGWGGFKWSIRHWMYNCLIVYKHTVNVTVLVAL